MYSVGPGPRKVHKAIHRGLLLKFKGCHIQTGKNNVFSKWTPWARGLKAQRCQTLLYYFTSAPPTKHFEEPLHKLKGREMIQFWKQLSRIDVKLKRKVPNTNENRLLSQVPPVFVVHRNPLLNPQVA